MEARETQGAPLGVRLAIALAAALGVLGLMQVVGSLSPELVVRKDFVQDWMLGRAVLDGLDPYTMLPKLYARYQAGAQAFPQPSPHPPPMVLVMLPLGLLSLRGAATLWLFVGVGSLVTAAVVALRAVGARPSPMQIALGALCAAAWFPIAEELVLGQLTAPLTLLLTLSWVALRSGRPVRGGLLLGASIAFKLLGWPLVVILLLRRQVKAAFVAGAAAGALNLATLPILGFEGLLRYYTATASLGSALYRGHVYNFSPYSLGFKLFEGTGSTALYGVHAAPFVDAPGLAGPAAAACLLAAVGAGVLVATRARSIDAAFGVGVCTSVVAGPIAWSPYLVALIPVAVILWAAWRDGRLGRPRLAAGAVAVLLVPRSWLVALLDVGTSGPPEIPVVHPAVTLVSWLPLVGVALLILAVSSMGGLEPGHGSRPVAKG
ncbi:MAG: DUF2029 domain-containing protein [Deltaproteobacteria bacterium]|nr:DUF2029 domain-containing protein [Deltaproteobacteria bacterium]MBW2254183.1 DUF2029 domain-containing protein [Deltaproteobacteria bacterium]